MNKNRSIRTKLIEVFVLVSILVFVVNLYILGIENKTVRQIDNVYGMNIQLNELSGTLEKLQNSIYQYLNTKSTDALENYYIYEQSYRDMLNDLNQETVSDSTKLTEKNIYNMSSTYLEKAGNTIDAKRGRKIRQYNEGYGQTKRIYEYLQSNISGVNTTVFLENSHNYSILRVSMKSFIGISMLLLLGVMITAIMWIIFVTGNITRPLIRLANAANEIAKGNMEVDFPIVETGDEISTVAKACNKMIDSIRVYIQKTKENYERENEVAARELIMKNDLKEAQLRYLQAQINPHFLFNSLNAGAQLAMMEGAEKACIFIENMADFFRYNVRKIDKETTLREELKLVDNYVFILNARFSGEIQYEKQLDERWLSVVMPSMILQPIIENSVNHGIREMEGAGEILLSVYSNGKSICIKVTDNGVGIERELANRIMAGESVHNDSQRDSAGIGMDNVINRMKWFYDIEHVIDIYPREAGGTEVILYIPMKKGDGERDQNTDM